MSENEVTSVVGAGPGLELLFLADNHLSDVAGLLGATNLAILDLSRNAIPSVAGLQNLTLLEVLLLEGNPVADLEVLQPLVDNDCFIDIWPGSESEGDVLWMRSGAERADVVAERLDR